MPKIKNKKNDKNINENVTATILLGAILLRFVVLTIDLCIKLTTHYFKLKKFSKEVDKYKSPADAYLTKKIHDITNDQTVKVIELEDDNGEVNSFTAGTGHLFYTKTLKEELENERELIAILLHEYGHYKEKHVNKMIVSRMFIDYAFEATVVSMGSVLLFIYANMPTVVVFNVVANLLKQLIPAEATAKLLDLMFSKKQEFISDSYAKKYGYEKELISVFKRWDDDMRMTVCSKIKDKDSCNSAIKRMHRFSEHPSFPERIEKLSKRLIDTMHIKGVKSPDIISRKWKRASKFIKSKMSDINKYGFSVD